MSHQRAQPQNFVHRLKVLFLGTLAGLAATKGVQEAMGQSHFNQENSSSKDLDGEDFTEEDFSPANNPTWLKNNENKLDPFPFPLFPILEAGTGWGQSVTAPEESQVLEDSFYHHRFGLGLPFQILNLTNAVVSAELVFEYPIRKKPRPGQSSFHSVVDLKWEALKSFSPTEELSLLLSGGGGVQLGKVTYTTADLTHTSSPFFIRFQIKTEAFKVWHTYAPFWEVQGVKNFFWGQYSSRDSHTLGRKTSQTFQSSGKFQTESVHFLMGVDSVPLEDEAFVQFYLRYVLQNQKWFGLLTSLRSTQDVELTQRSVALGFRVSY